MIRIFTFLIFSFYIGYGHAQRADNLFPELLTPQTVMKDLLRPLKTYLRRLSAMSDIQNNGERCFTYFHQELGFQGAFTRVQLCPYHIKKEKERIDGLSFFIQGREALRLALRRKGDAFPVSDDDLLKGEFPFDDNGLTLSAVRGGPVFHVKKIKGELAYRLSFENTNYVLEYELERSENKERHLYRLACNQCRTLRSLIAAGEKRGDFIYKRFLVSNRNRPVTPQGFLFSYSLALISPLQRFGNYFIETLRSRGFPDLEQ